MNKSQLVKWIRSNIKLIALILSLITFLLLTQIAFAQSSLKTIKSSVKTDTICISKSLADTIIHDLQERKMLLIQNQALSSYKDILNKEMSEKDAKINELNLDKEKYKRKAQLRGWQRNGLVLGMIIFGIVVL